MVALLLAARTIANIKWACTAAAGDTPVFRSSSGSQRPCCFGSLISIIVFYGASDLSSLGEGFPRSFWVAEALFSATILGGLRFGIRAAYHHTRAPTACPQRPAQPCCMEPVKRASMSPAQRGESPARASVRSVFWTTIRVWPDKSSVTSRCSEALSPWSEPSSSTGADTLLITMPRATGAAVRRVVEAALALNLDVRTVPSLAELLDGSLDAFRVRRVQVEDLLRRPIVTERVAEVDELFRDRTVLITGGGGSIGSELARQIFALGPRRLVLVDRAESPLYLVQRELETRRRRGQGSGEVRIHLGKCREPSGDGSADLRSRRPA